MGEEGNGGVNSNQHLGARRRTRSVFSVGTEGGRAGGGIENSEGGAQLREIHYSCRSNSSNEHRHACGR